MTGSGDSRGLPSPAVLLVTADIDIDVDGFSARLEGDGRHLVLRSDHPHRVWSSLARASLPDSVGNVSGLRAAGRAARAMADVGIHLDVQGPGGAVVSLGDGESSMIGRLVTGSSAVRPRSVRSLLPFVGAAINEVLRRRRHTPSLGRRGAGAP